MRSKKYKRPARKHRMDKHPLPTTPPNWGAIQQWPRLLMMRNATNLQARRKLLPSASVRRQHRGASEQSSPHLHSEHARNK